MTEQPTFADLEYQYKRRQTRREVFLERIDSLIPWERLEERIRPHYFKAELSRRPYPLSVMLRVHLVQLCYNVSDPGMEDPRFHGGRLCCMRRSQCGALRGYGCLSHCTNTLPCNTILTCATKTVPRCTA